MGVGPNYVTRKGFLVQGTVAYVTGEIATIVGDGLINRATTLNDQMAFGVTMEDMTAVRLVAAPNKIAINVALEGIVRVTAGAAITLGDRVTNNAVALAVTRTKAIAGAQPLPILGIALEAASAAGVQIDVLLTPGGTY